MLPWLQQGAASPGSCGSSTASSHGRPAVRQAFGLATTPPRRTLTCNQGTGQGTPGTPTRAPCTLAASQLASTHRAGAHAGGPHHIALQAGSRESSASYTRHVAPSGMSGLSGGRVALCARTLVRALGRSAVQTLPAIAQGTSRRTAWRS